MYNAESPRDVVASDNHLSDCVTQYHDSCYLISSERSVILRINVSNPNATLSGAIKKKFAPNLLIIFTAPEPSVALLCSCYL